MNANLRAAIHGEMAIPDRLGEADAPLDWPCICVGAVIARLPDGTLAYDLALHPANRVLVDAVA